MMADDAACNSRNKEPGTIFNHPDRKRNLYSTDGVQVDYRGDQVTVETFLRLMTDRHEDAVSHLPGLRNKRLLTNANSNLLVYMTGHGNDEFLKFQDNHEITALDLANTMHELFLKGRFRQCLFLLDTCQAASMFHYVKVPNFMGIGSSPRGQSSYSHHVDEVLGLPVVDRFTMHTYSWFEKTRNDKSMGNDKFSLYKFINSLDSVSLLSDPQFFTTIPALNTKKCSLLDFFGNKRSVHVNRNVVLLESFTVDLPFEDEELPIIVMPWHLETEYPNYQIKPPTCAYFIDIVYLLFLILLFGLLVIKLVHKKK